VNRHMFECPNVDIASAGSLVDRVMTEPWLVEALDAVAASSLPDAWIGAGVVRDVVWGQLGGGFHPETVRDIDVVFFDRDDHSEERERAAEHELAALASRPWEATNQAGVHTWYHRAFGGTPVLPFTSIHDAVATWPEYATSVAIRRTPDGLDVCAPHGLGDLLNGVWRRNPTRVSPEYSRARLARQRVDERWPTVRVIG
jgi:uncharacterized protein